MIIYKKDSGIPSVYYDQAVDEALCFGWIDSKPNKRDATSYFQYFSKRNPKSNWSQVNKEKIQRLRATGKLALAGEAMIALAQQSGTWTALDNVENLVLPDDLKAVFAAQSLGKTCRGPLNVVAWNGCEQPSAPLPAKNALMISWIRHHAKSALALFVIKSNFFYLKHKLLYPRRYLLIYA